MSFIKSFPPEILDPKLLANAREIMEKSAQDEIDEEASRRSRMRKRKRSLAPPNASIKVGERVRTRSTRRPGHLEAVNGNKAIIRHPDGSRSHTTIRNLVREDVAPPTVKSSKPKPSLYANSKPKKIKPTSPFGSGGNKTDSPTNLKTAANDNKSVAVSKVKSSKPKASVIGDEVEYAIYQVLEQYDFSKSEILSVMMNDISEELSTKIVGWMTSNEVKKRHSDILEQSVKWWADRITPEPVDKLDAIDESYSHTGTISRIVNKHQMLERYKK